MSWSEMSQLTDNSVPCRIPLHPKTASLTSADLSYGKMEDELTCPVCLELYADPLMLPCSHSICKKCLTDILDSRIKVGKDGIECPSCRKTLPVNKDKISKLPRNLALENIVFRYQEMQSQTLTQTKSLDLSLDLRQSSPSGHSDLDSPVFMEESNENCGLCEPQYANKATWFCDQCVVSYCQKCLDNYHPKRGPLFHHRLKKPCQKEAEGKPAFCEDHETEVAAIFCDQCKVLVCHLCVCDCIGKHSGHKILSQDTAWTQVKDTVSSTKEKLSSMASTLCEHSSKLEEISQEIELIHRQACQKMDTQYARLIEDLTCALQHNRLSLSEQMSATKSQTLTKLKSQLEDNRNYSKTIENLLDSCKKMLDEDHRKGLLSHAGEVEPIVQQVQQLSTDVQSGKSRNQELVSEKSTQQELHQSVAQFRKAAQSCLKLFIANDEEQYETIIPIVRSSTSPGKEAPRVQNKCLITWGFNSTSFTAEALKGNSLWSVTVEKNTSHLGDIKNGYLFGVGISSEPLSFKDLVGMNSKSYGVVCSDGNLVFCYDGKMEHLAALDCLPISVTIHVTLDQPEKLFLAYTFTDASWGDTLQGRKILKDCKLKQSVYPVFTVSQRVKMQFPTYV